jgi:hypothetical protein
VSGLTGRRAALGGLLALGLTSCGIFEDNGTHLAFALVRAAQALRASGDQERVVDYEPMTGIDQHYEIRLRPSHQATAPYGGYVIVTGRNGGGTSYQAREVFITRAFEVSKFMQAAHITLRNNAGRIELVALN